MATHYSLETTAKSTQVNIFLSHCLSIELKSNQFENLTCFIYMYVLNLCKDLWIKQNRLMFETQKVRRHDKFRKEWSQHYNKCKSQMGQDQDGVRRRKRPLLASHTRCKIWAIRSKLVVKSNSVIGSHSGVISDQLRVSLCMVMSQNAM